MTTTGRREFGRLATAFALGGCATAPRPRMTAPAEWSGYDDALVIDALGGPGAWVSGQPEGAPLTDAIVHDARASGVTAVNVTVGALGEGPDLLESTFREIAFWERELERHPDVFLKVKTVTDLREAKAKKRLGLIYGFQDATPLGKDLTRLDLFHRFGVRIVQPTYNLRNLLGDGCLAPDNGGLTAFGREAIERMNELGILIDLSHSGQRTTADAIAHSKRPVAFTHAGCAALVNFPRNKRNEELRALADKGGVVGIYLMPFLRAKGQPSASDFVAHVEHALAVCGEDHVGIGTDGVLSPTPITAEFKAVHRAFVASRQKSGIAAPGEDEEVYNLVPELDTVRRFEQIARLLLARGHTEARVEKILGQNFARVFASTWSATSENASAAGRRG